MESPYDGTPRIESTKSDGTSLEAADIEPPRVDQNVVNSKPTEEILLAFQEAFPGYTDLEYLYDVNNVCTFRAKDAVRGIAVFLKACLESKYLDAMTRIRHEWNCQLVISEISGIKMPRSLETCNDNKGLMLVFSDDGEYPAFVHFGLHWNSDDFRSPQVTSNYGDSGIDLNVFLSFAVQVVGVLDQLHSRGITHCNLNPYTLGIDSDGNGIISDLSCSTFLEKEDGSSTLITPRQLPFMSPESSGRINRSVDMRSDFYSLGVCFYFILTGFCPFTSDNALDLIYHHIAHAPIPPDEVCSDIPKAISSIVLKLMSKSPEDRYQSGKGLMSDLEQLQQYCVSNDLQQYTTFAPGLTDSASQFSIPEKLFGVEEEIQAMLSCFNHVKLHAGGRVALIKGASGTGKSSLVNEIQRPVLEARSFFAAGKFDQYKRGIPFFSLIQAGAELVRQLVSDSDLNLQEFKEQIINNLGADAAAVFHVLPELQMLFSDYAPPQMTNLGPSEREQRFTAAFLRFILSFAKRSSPLVLFLDDIQWSSAIELNLIANLVIEANSSTEHGLMLIIAYRDNEVGDGHPARTMIQKIVDASVHLEIIEVKNMDLLAIQAMLAATLRLSQDVKNPELITLAKLTLAKTHGNAFFITQLLRRLKEQDLLFYDFKQLAWRFDLAAILHEDLPETVIDLLLAQIHGLNDGTRHCLQLASCIGTNRFSLLTLSIVAEQRLKTTAKDLWPALQMGLLLPTSSAYKASIQRLPVSCDSDTDVEASISDDSLHSEDQRARDSSYRFLHDKVQQACYQMIPKSDRPRTHLSIGLRLLAHFEATGQLGTFLFEVVNQINRGLIVLPQEHLDEAIKLNLQAGKKALQATAFDAALLYLETAKNSMPDSWWQTNFEHALDISLSHIDAVYATHDYKTAVDSLRHLAAKARDSIERARIMYRLIDVFMGLDDLESAITTGLDAMDSLGMTMPRNEEAAEQTLHKSKSRLDSLRIPEIDAISEMKVTKNAKVLLLQAIATSVLLPIYLNKPGILQAVASIAVILTLENGISEAGAYPLVMYGLTITHTNPSAKSRLQGYHFGRAAVRIVDSASVSSLTASTPKVLKVFASHIAWWNEPTKNALVYFNSAISAGLQTFNVEYTTYGWAESCSYAFWAGEPVVSVVQRLTSYLPAIRRTRQQQTLWYATIQLQGYVNLMKPTEDPADIEGPIFSTKAEYKLVLELNSHVQIFVFLLAKLFVVVYFSRPRDVSDSLIDELETYVAGSQGTAYVAKFAFLVCSSLLRHFPTLSGQDSARFYEYYNKLKFFQSGTPTAFSHEIAFIEAEILGHRGADLDALDRYESAYEAAEAVGNIHEAGHIAERTYQWLETKNKNLAKKYIFKCYDCFVVAGFQAKTRCLLIRYPDVLTPEALQNRATEHLVPFRTVNMQMNRDGTLSKVTNGNLPQSESTRSTAHLDDEHLRDDRSLAAKTDHSGIANGRTSGGASVSSLRLKTMPPRTISLNSQIASSDSLHENDVTPTGTMSSFLSSSRHWQNHASRSTLSSKRMSSGSPGVSEDYSKRSTVEGAKDFDLDVALKASVLISDVLSVSEVLQRLIETVLMNAGADYGVLLLYEKGSLFIEAKGRNSAVEIVNHQLLSVVSNDVPSTLINYVSRLRETVVLGSGLDYRSFQAKFGKDTYFRDRTIRSVMCMPVQNTLKLIGVLYLENSSTAYTFGPRKVELLNFLCSQAAVAIEKARLYKDLESARDDAQASNRMKSEFLSTISHEIRTPFNAVLGMSGFLLDTQLSSMQIDYVETIRNSSKELLRIIDDLLDFSKLEYGTFELHKEDFSLRECIEGALQVTAERAASKELELAYFNEHTDFPDVLVNDMTRFRQVVINLLGNSIKFTQQGSVTIVSHATMLNAATETQNAVYRIQVSVRDTGIGIKEEDHKKLFKLFSQIDSSLARSFSGTGLGLAISDKLVRLMNGQIWVESQPGIGSTFHFTIVTEVKSIAPPPQHPLSTRLQGLGVLILDDSEVATRALRESIEWMGMRALVSRTVDQLTNAIAANPPGTFQIALIDLHYGLADALLPRIAAYDPNCKIMRLSRFGHRQNFDEKYQYLIKPVKRERLARVFIEVLLPDLATEHNKTAVTDDKLNPIALGLRHPLRILLAEDNLINSRVALQHLKRMGYSAVHAKDGQYCLEEEAKAIFDVILMDVQMPRLDGCQAATIIRTKYAQQPERCPRIVAMTANAMRGDMERCIQAGCHAYCQKPIIADVLAQRLMEATRRPEE